MKTRVKIFRVPACECRYDRIRSPSFTKVPMDTDGIENMLNQFLMRKNVISIIATPVTEQRHNNGGYDTVSLIYTVIYQEENGIEEAT